MTINGKIDVYDQCSADGSCTALNDSWRSMSNLTIDVTGGDGCHASGEFWAVSQAAPLRRVAVRGADTTLMDHCSGPAYASGGFLTTVSLNRRHDRPRDQRRRTGRDADHQGPSTVVGYP